MNNRMRYLIAAALLATLAACGNKGPLVRPSAAAAEPVPMATPAATDPTDATPVEQVSPPPAADPATATPPPTPPAGG